MKLYFKSKIVVGQFCEKETNFTKNEFYDFQIC